MSRLLNGALRLEGDTAETATGVDNRLVQLVRAAVGTNPRSIKRPLNAFELLQLVARDEQPLSVELRRAMIALLCAQTAYPALHAELVNAAYASPDGEEDVLVAADTLADGYADAEDQLARLLGVEEVSPPAHAAFKRFHRLLLAELTGNGDEANGDLLKRAVRLTQVTAVRQPPRDGQETDGGLVITDLGEIRDLAEQVSTPGAAEDTVRTIDEMNRILGEQGRPVTCLAHSTQPYVVIYASDDAASVQATGRRARPRVASIQYGRKGLRLTFGRRVAERGEDKLGYGSEWDELVAALEADSGREASPLLNGATFRTSTSGYPLVVEGVRGEQVSAIAALIAKIYEIANSVR